MTEVMIDPNVRVAGGLTFSGFEDVRGPMPIAGQAVLVREPEANLVAAGTIDHVDEADRLVYIRVDWTELMPDQLPTPAEFVINLRRAQGGLFRPPISRVDAALTA